MKAYLCAVNLLVHAHHHPESAIADGLGGILAPDMRKHAGANSGLIDGRSPATISVHPSPLSLCRTTACRTSPPLPCGPWGRSDDRASRPTPPHAHGSRARRDAAPSRRHRTPDRGTGRTADDGRPGESPAARPERIELDECGCAAVSATCRGARLGSSRQDRRSDAQTRSAGDGDRRFSDAPARLRRVAVSEKGRDHPNACGAGERSLATWCFRRAWSKSHGFGGVLILGRHSLGLCCGLNRPRSASRASREAIGGRRPAIGGPRSSQA
jgi:hypothetical protein